MALYINRRAPQSGLASVLATRGRMGDTELVHMTKPEVQRLMNTGLMSLNPQTGLPEYFFGDIFRGVKNFAKNLFKPQNLIPLVASIALPMVAGPLFAGGGLLGSVGGFLGSAGTNALLSGLGTFAGKMVTGSDFDDAAYAGLTSGAMRYGTGKLGQMLGPGDEAVRSNLQSSLGGGVTQGQYQQALGQAARQNIGVDVGFGESLQDVGGDWGEMTLLESIDPVQGTILPSGLGAENLMPAGGVSPQALGMNVGPQAMDFSDAVNFGTFQGPTVANLQRNLNDTALYGVGIDQNYNPVGYTDAAAQGLEDVFNKNILNQQNLAAQNRAMGRALMQGKVTPQAAGLESLTPAELATGAEELKTRIIRNEPYKLTALSDKMYGGELTDEQAFKAALAQATPTGGDVKLVTDEAFSLSRDPYTPFRESIGWKGDLSMPTAGFNMETAKNVAASLPLDTMLSSGLTSAEASMYVDEQAALEEQYKQYEEGIKAKGGTPISLTQFRRQRQALNQPLNRADALRAATQGGGYQYYGPTSYTPLGAHSVSPLNQLARASGGLISLGHGGRPDFEGMVQGRGHGMEDNVIMDIKEKGGLLAVSPKEYVVPADVMAMLGNGNPDDGAEEMDSFISKFRQKKYGRDRQPPEMDGGKALQSLMKG